MNVVKYIGYHIFTKLGREVCRREYMGSDRRKLNERAVEYGLALRYIYQNPVRTILDVGTGLSAWPSILTTCGYSVTAIDSMGGYWQRPVFNRHYYIIRDDITNSRLSRRFDMATCISTLEHIPNHSTAISGMFNLMKPKGLLILTFPYNEQQYVENVYNLPGAGYGKDAPYICQVFSRRELDLWLANNRGNLVSQHYFEVFDGPLWTFGNRLPLPREVTVSEKHHLTLVVIQKDGSI